MATNSRSHQIQGTDVCLQDHNWRCTNIPKLASSNLCALQKLAFCKWTTPCGAIPKRHQITLTDLFLDCAQLVEWPPDLNSNSWVFSYFQKTSKNTPDENFSRPDKWASGVADSPTWVLRFLCLCVSCLYVAETVGDIAFAWASNTSNSSLKPTIYSCSDLTKSTALHRSRSTACNATLVPWKRWRTWFHIVQRKAVSSLFIFLCSDLASFCTVRFCVLIPAMFISDSWILA